MVKKLFLPKSFVVDQFLFFLFYVFILL
eukprot:UN21364